MSETQNEGSQGTPPNTETKLAEYEKICKSNNEKINGLQKELEQKNAEIVEYKKRMAEMQEEIQLAQKIISQRAKETEEVDALKSKSEDTLTKAKSIIFERTKTIKNQELQIEAYHQQIDSLKDVVRITKDLLEIRDLEVRQLEKKINCMEERVKTERERQNLMHKQLETMIRHNGELKREYETQLCLFSALRERYSERELAKGVVDDLKGATPVNPALNAKKADGSGGSSEADGNKTVAEVAKEAVAKAEAADKPDVSNVDGVDKVEVSDNVKDANKVKDDSKAETVSKIDVGTPDISKVEVAKDAPVAANAEVKKVEAVTSNVETVNKAVGNEIKAPSSPIVAGTTDGSKVEAGATNAEVKKVEAVDSPAVGSNVETANENVVSDLTKVTSPPIVVAASDATKVEVASSTEVPRNSAETGTVHVKAEPAPTTNPQATTNSDVKKKQ